MIIPQSSPSFCNGICYFSTLTICSLFPRNDRATAVSTDCKQKISNKNENFNCTVIQRTRVIDLTENKRDDRARLVLNVNINSICGKLIINQLLLCNRTDNYATLPTRYRINTPHCQAVSALTCGPLLRNYLFSRYSVKAEICNNSRTKTLYKISLNFYRPSSQLRPVILLTFS